ncbi:hypothetical protein B0H13DRAFT_152715 [Mycena leptocephala]|nr:hypothetical protein B0H13DRAFT_152715 [Mycena leptocephala]
MTPWALFHSHLGQLGLRPSRSRVLSGLVTAKYKRISGKLSTFRACICCVVSGPVAGALPSDGSSSSFIARLGQYGRSLETNIHRRCGCLVSATGCASEVGAECAKTEKELRISTAPLDFTVNEGHSATGAKREGLRARHGAAQRLSSYVNSRGSHVNA